MGGRKMREVIQELDTSEEARTEAKRDPRGFLKSRIPELPDEAEVKFREDMSWWIGCCCWGFCIWVGSE